MQAGGEARAMDLLATAGSLAETDDVRVLLLQPTREGDLFGVKGERHEADFAIAVVTLIRMARMPPGLRTCWQLSISSV